MSTYQVNAAAPVTFADETITGVDTTIFTDPHSLLVEESGAVADEYSSSPYVAYFDETITGVEDELWPPVQTITITESTALTDDYNSSPEAVTLTETISFSETSTATHTSCDTTEVAYDLPVLEINLEIPAGGAGIAGIQLPKLEISNTIGTGGIGETQDLSLPVHDISAVGTDTNEAYTDDNFNLPVVTATGTLLVGGIGTTSFSVNEIETSDFNLPVPTIYGEEQLGAGALDLPVVEVSGVGVPSTVAGGASGEGEFDLPAPTISGAGLANGIGTAAFGLFDGGYFIEIAGTGSATVGTGSATLPVIEIEGRGVSGGIGTASFQLPVLTVTSGDAAPGSQSGTGTLTTPLPMIIGLCVSTQVQTAGLMEVVFSAMNTKTGAVSEYRSFNVNSLAMSGGTLLGASDTGIYAIGADTDDGTEIPVALRKTYLGQDTPEEKRITEMYVFAEAGSDYSVDALADGAAFPVGTTVARDGYHTGKAHMPRGLKGRAVGFGISGDGSPHEIDQIDLVVEIMDRRLR